MSARRLSAYRASSIAEHRSIESARWLGVRKAPVKRTEFTAVVVEQSIEVAFARRVHDENLARMRASA